MSKGEALYMGVSVLFYLLGLIGVFAIKEILIVLKDIRDEERNSKD